MHSSLNKIFKLFDRFKPSKKVNTYTQLLIFNIVLILFQIIYILLRYKYVNDLVPFWYSKLWGDTRLAPKDHLYYIWYFSIFLTIGMTSILFLLNKFFIRYIHEVCSFFLTLWNVLLTYSLVKIIFSASQPYPPLINPSYISLGILFFISFLAAYIALPIFTEYVRSKNIVTNPVLHRHPAMILQKPTARGAGFLYAVIFLTLSIIFVGFRADLLGFYISIIFVASLGIFDDYQNTHPRSKFRILENPAIRLTLLFFGISFVVLSGIRIEQISNPLGGIIDLTKMTLTIGGAQIPYLSVLISIIWIVWILNLLSWSNGIDGQYSGIVGIASATIAILALRFTDLEPVHKAVASMAMISSGVAFGFARYTWHPSKIMWGFGAVAAGLTVAVLSILIKAKVVTSVLIILIPFLDAFVTVARRLLQKKNPLVGDRGHLHHILLERGWKVPKVAIFYWVTTAIFGFIGIVSSEKYIVQVGLTLIVIVGFFIVLLNLKSLKEKKLQ